MGEITVTDKHGVEHLVQENCLKEKATKYPCLMSSGLGTVVLFTSHRTGIVVCGNRIYGSKLGKTSTTWDMSAFHPVTAEWSKV